MNNKRPNPPTVAPADAAKGAAAEIAFRRWLSASDVAFLYVEQSPETFPERLRGKLKRPDYLVGVGVSSIAFDVKAKTAYERDGLIFDLDEVRKLRRFARLFAVQVFFACLDPEGGTGSYWVRLDQLDFARLTMRAGKQTVACPLDRAMSVDMSFSFRDAFQDAVELI